MYTVLVVMQVLVGVALVGLVLIQHGKGADAGAAFGSGASGTVFGARGASNFLTRTTAWLAAGFFASSLALAYLVNNRTGGGGSSVVDGIEAEPAAVAPSADPSSDAPAAVAPAEAAPVAEKAPKVPE